MIRPRLMGVLALCATLLAPAACTVGRPDPTANGTSFLDCATEPASCNGGPTKPGGTLGYAIGHPVTGWNLAAAGSASFDLGQVLGGVLPSPYITYPDYSLRVNDNLMFAIDMVSTAPQTIVYRIKPGAVWDDGTPIGVDDFGYAWRTRNGRDCPECRPLSTLGYDRIRSVDGSEGGRTVTVVFDRPYTDWQQLFGSLYPAHVARRHGDLAQSWRWFDANPPAFSGGPYTLQAGLTEVPNPRWYGAVKPTLDRLVFHVIPDPLDQVLALRSKQVQAIYPPSTQQLVTEVKSLAPDVQEYLGASMTYAHLELNLGNRFLADKTLRQAILIAVNRQDIIDRTIGRFVQGAEPVNSHNFLIGLQGYTDIITPTGQGSGDAERARKLLTAAGYSDVDGELKTPSGTPVPPLRIRFPAGDALRQRTIGLVAAQLDPLGLKVSAEPSPEFDTTLRTGDFDAVVLDHVGQQFVFGDAVRVWLSTSDTNYGHWSNPESDRLIREAAAQTERQKGINALNKADELLTDDAYSLPLFLQPAFLAVYRTYANIRHNPSAPGPVYNVQEWGVRTPIP